MDRETAGEHSVAIERAIDSAALAIIAAILIGDIGDDTDTRVEASIHRARHLLYDAKTTILAGWQHLG